MIINSRDKATARFASGRHVKEFSGFARQAEMRLTGLMQRRVWLIWPHCQATGWKQLKGNRAGQFSIRINDQWRICFKWPDGSPGPVDVEIVDYH